MNGGVCVFVAFETEGAEGDWAGDGVPVSGGGPAFGAFAEDLDFANVEGGNAHALFLQTGSQEESVKQMFASRENAGGLCASGG